MIRALAVLSLGVLSWPPVQAAQTAHAKTQVADAVADKLQALTDADYHWIAQKLYQNEASQNPAYLTFWHPQEPFPSFGIGHFIWIPAGVDAPFVETFADMVTFVSAHRSPPAWLQVLHSSSQFKPPWRDRSHFQQAQNSIEMQQLRDWLLATADSQARFIVQRLVQQLAQVSQRLTQHQQALFNRHLMALLQTKQGVFALIDYSNFKGIGLNAKKTYQGEGWGLVEVLLAMPSSVTAEQAVPKFVLTAKQVLQNRVKNARPGQNESHWLPGWYKRVEGYLNE